MKEKRIAYMKVQNLIYNKGSKLTQRVLDQILVRNGIVKVNPIKEKFDPNIHDALMEV